MDNPLGFVIHVYIVFMGTLALGCKRSSTMICASTNQVLTVAKVPPRQYIYMYDLHNGKELQVGHDGVVHVIG